MVTLPNKTLYLVVYILQWRGNHTCVYAFEEDLHKPIAMYYDLA